MHTRIIHRDQLPETMQESWVDPQRKPYVTGDSAFIPVKPGLPYTHDIPERRRTGRGYQRIGDIIAFHGSPPDTCEVEELWSTGRYRGIILVHGHIGSFREPDITVLRGEAGEVCHHEAGISYSLDVRRLMFSQGNREEKRRIAGMVSPGERIADMFAGIGYFTLPLAKAGGNVHAMEINPFSFGYLKKNIRDNNLCSQVQPECGDCRECIHGTYDRIQMGFFESILFLPYALQHSRKGTVLHLHTIGKKEDKILEILHQSHQQAELSEHRVKKVGPGKMHLVYDLELV